MYPLHIHCMQLEAGPALEVGQSDGGHSHQDFSPPPSPPAPLFATGPGPAALSGASLSSTARLQREARLLVRQLVQQGGLQVCLCAQSDAYAVGLGGWLTLAAFL